MSTTSPECAATRRALVRALAPVRAKLILRQAARSAAAGVAGAAAGVIGAFVFFALLPWLLFGGALSVWLAPTLAAGATCGVLACFVSLRGWRPPSDLDCALALESGTDANDASLPTALALSGAEPFGAAVLAQAQQRVSKASHMVLPAAVSTPKLVGAPLMALCAAVTLLGGFRLPYMSGERPLAGGVAHAASAAKQGAAASSHSASDLKAFEEAMGLRKVQNSMKALADDLRNAAATEDQRQASLDKARAAQDGAKTGAEKAHLPMRVPSDAAGKEQLARRAEELAGVASARAQALEDGKAAASVDGGGDVKAVETVWRKMEAAPSYDARRFEEAGQALSGQSAGRRALAQSAVDALARIKQGN